MQRCEHICPLSSLLCSPRLPLPLLTQQLSQSQMGQELADIPALASLPPQALAALESAQARADANNKRVEVRLPWPCMCTCLPRLDLMDLMPGHGLSAPGL